MAGRDGTVGILGTTGSNRPSFFVHLFRLYQRDTTFRALTDFTVMGVVVLLFLHPGVKDLFKSSPSGGTSQTTAKGPSAPPSPAQTAPASQTSSPQAPPTVVTRQGPAIQFPQDVNVPSLGNYVIVDIDESAFRSSPASDQPRLAAAARAARSQQFAEAINQLRDANAADRNVAFMRGLALMNTGKAAEAEPALRTASGAGQRQASILLGRLLITAPSGVTKNVAEGRRLIETAADAGDRLGQRVAAIGYITGEFGAFDPIKARDLLRQASQGGDAPAMLFYAHMLDGGLGGPADLDGAVDLLRRAAAAGLTSAQEILGSWLWRSGAPRPSPTRAKSPNGSNAPTSLDSPRARRRCSPSCLGDNATPANVQNKAKAYELLRLCSGLRHALCQINYAWALRFGVGIGRDLVRAYAHADIARQLNHADGQKVLSALDTQLSEADKARAAQLIRTIQRASSRTAALAPAVRGRRPATRANGLSHPARPNRQRQRARQARQRPSRREPRNPGSAPSRAGPGAVPAAPPQVATAPMRPLRARARRSCRSPPSSASPIAADWPERDRRLVHPGGSNAWVESNSSGRTFRLPPFRNPTRSPSSRYEPRHAGLDRFHAAQMVLAQSVAGRLEGRYRHPGNRRRATYPSVTRAIDQDADRVGRGLCRL